jgi:hypothetical protein
MNARRGKPPAEIAALFIPLTTRRDCRENDGIFSRTMRVRHSPQLPDGPKYLCLWLCCTAQ